MNLKKMRAEAAAKAAEYQTRLSGGENLSDADLAAVKTLLAEISDLDAQIAKADEKSALLSDLGSVADQAQTDVKAGGASPAKSLGEHFVKTVKDAGIHLTPETRFEAPEFKATTDIAQVGGAEGGYGPYITDVDRQAVFPYTQNLQIADLIPQGRISGSVLKYPVFPAPEGEVATVAEGGTKPQVSFGEPTWHTESLSEIAAWTGISDTMAEDLPYIQTQINQQLIRMLILAEENQIISGDGAGSNLTGILNREGVLVREGDDAAEEIQRAKADIRKATKNQWQADAIVIHPDDYTALTLRRDGNGQFYGGGFFQNAYGNGVYQTDLPIWGLRTIQSDAVPAGTALVGAFKSALLFRKNGIQLAVSDSHADFFIKDQIAIRAKQRVGLEVKYPAAFAKVTFTPVSEAA